MGNTANKASLRFHGALNDFLRPEKRDNPMVVPFNLAPSAKDLIESVGVPHTEILTVKINGADSTLDYNVQPGDRLDIYPRSFAGILQAPDTGSETVVPLPSRFVADVHLGKLARLMRLTGIDTVYDSEADDKQIVERAVRENRSVLTRDRDLLRHGDLKFGYGYWLRSTAPDRQIVEVITYFDLKEVLDPFTRCLDCNGTLVRVELQEVKNRVPEKVRRWCEEYVQCRHCRKVFWKGSHYESLQKKVGEILEQI